MFLRKENKILFIFLIITQSFIANVKNESCHSSEININNWCYKLLELRSLSPNCTNHTSSTCVRDLIYKLVKLYTLNARLEDGAYEFSILESPLNDRFSYDMWLELMRKVQQQTDEVNVFINQYKYNENVYVENQSVDDEYPNLMIHDDYGSSRDSSSKCIYGYQITNYNESFNFKYTSCDEKLPFICVKSLNKLFSDRCLSYRNHYPGGNWVECDRVMSKSDLNETIFNLSNSQKV